MSLIFNEAFAQSTPPAPGGGGGTTTQTQVPTGTPPGVSAQPGPLGMLLPFVLMFGVIYFLIIRPQQKKMKQHQSTLETIKYGDEIVTNGGIFGKVTGITDRVLTVEIADGVRIKMLKGQVASVNPSVETAAKSVEKGA